MYTPTTKDHPSFSSSLLDQIYRSIDQQQDHQKPIVYTKATNEVRLHSDLKTSSHRTVNSSSSSSGSSSRGGFSSSDTESVSVSVSKPKSVRTNISRQHAEYIKNEKNQINMYNRMYQFQDLQIEHKHESQLVKKKSRAMKMCGDLKKVKQPISPGGRLATFLNSLFNTKYTNRIDRRSKSVSGSICSSASSVSRSCLNKTDSSSSSVIVGDECKPRGRRSMYADESNLRALKFVKKTSNEDVRVCSTEKMSRTEEAPRSFSKNYQRKVECEFDLIKGKNEIDLNYDEDEDDDASYTSSDLFELENLFAIGMGSYGDELPVFETTRLNKGLASVMALSCNQAQKITLTC